MKKISCAFFCCVSCIVFGNEILPAKELPLEDAYGIGVDTAFIYWIAKEEGLSYATSGFALPPGTSSIPPGTTNTPSFKFGTGFKAGLDFFFAHDNWIVSTTYTWLKNGYNQKTNHVTDSLYYANFVFDLNDIPHIVDVASAKWKIQHNNLTLDLGRETMLSRYFSNYSFIGLNGAWNTQHYIVKYIDFLGNFTSETLISMAQHFSGIGLRAGSNLNFFMSPHWILFASFSFSELWSDFDVTQKYRTPTQPNDPWIASLKNAISALKPVFTWDMGLKWEAPAKDDLYAFLMQIGWEQQIWFSQNQFRNVWNSVSGDLTFQGLTVKFELLF
ncbi:MAG: hypothetical protein HY860_03745 [Chlamydiales bacterium]|nr:hypothetical protein [Chlamydiales bacterium]